MLPRQGCLNGPRTGPGESTVTRFSLPDCAPRLALTLLILLGGSGLPLPVPTAQAQTGGLPSDPRFFPQTAYRIDTDAFWNFFQQRGNVRTFGYPVSRTFMLDGFQVQIFQREIMQLQ